MGCLKLSYSDSKFRKLSLFQTTYNSYKKATQIVGEKGSYQFGYNPLKTRSLIRFFAKGSTEASLIKIYSADHAIEVEIKGNQTRILTYVDGGPYEASVIHTATFPSLITPPVEGNYQAVSSTSTKTT